MSFDSAGVTGNPKELQLRLEASGVEAFERIGPKPTVQPLRRDPPVDAILVAPTAVPDSSVRTIRGSGPLEFRLTVPFVPGRVAEVNRTVTAQGIPVTLEKVVVTPTETRAYLRFSPPADIPPEHWSPIASLSVAGWDSSEGERGMQGGGPSSDGAYRYSFSSPLYDKRGEWTLTVKELVGIDPRRFEPEKGIVPQTRVAGPWVFRFTVP